MKHLSSYIDHTNLKASATKEDIIKLCEEAKKYKFQTVCINSCYVKLAKILLKDSPVKICTVIGFPLGAMSTASKVYETRQALFDGADEIDMVINIGYLKSKEFIAVKNDIKSVKNCLPNNILKVILETCYLDESVIIKASELAIEAGADYLKTSTGFGTAGATLAHVKLMKHIANNQCKIKASGGIKDFKTAIEYIHAGADRLGTSSGISIVTGKKVNSDKNY